MKRLREFCLHHHITALWQAPMADYTSFRIGGKADAFILPDSEAVLGDTVGFLKKEGIPFRIIGNGTNLLVSDGGYRGALITTRHIRSVFVNGEEAKAGCGAPISVLCRRLADFGLTGLERLYGIPGTVGGAVYMNAGAYGGHMSDVVSLVSVLDTKEGENIAFHAADCLFSYRSSLFAKERQYVILSVELKLKRDKEANVRERMRRYLSMRMDKQPTALPSAGSAFLRPEGYYAGKLIEEAGLSGYRVGGAAVSIKHAGFIVNLGGATAKDVCDLMRHVTERVKEAFGVALVPEIEYIDEDGRICDPLLANL